MYNRAKVLAENGSVHLVGSRRSLADVGLMESLLMTTDYFGEQLFHDYPHLKVSRLTSHSICNFAGISKNFFS